MNNQSEKKQIISAKTPLIFMHIPKTGGMSMFTAFTRLWRTSIADLYNISPRNPERALSALKDQSKILYCGHYSFGMHKWLERPSYYAAVLREPVSRLVSLYYYCQPMIATYRNLLKQADGDIERLKADTRLSDYYFDFISQPQIGTNPEDFFNSPSAELDNGMVRRFSGYGLNPDKCPDSELELAKNNIKNYFSVVGLLERYPETLEMMSKTFCLPTLKENHVNKNPPDAKKNTLSDSILNKIKEKNSLDIALYDWVCNRFNEQLKVQSLKLIQPERKTSALEMPLWLGVGESPLREASMKSGGELNELIKPIFLQRLAKMQVQTSSRLIFTDVDTVVRSKGNETQPGERIRLIINKNLAQALIDSLQKSVDVLEKIPQNKAD